MGGRRGSGVASCGKIGMYLISLKEYAIRPDFTLNTTERVSPSQPASPSCVPAHLPPPPPLQLQNRTTTSQPAQIRPIRAPRRDRRHIAFPPERDHKTIRRPRELQLHNPSLPSFRPPPLPPAPAELSPRPGPRPAPAMAGRLGVGAPLRAEVRVQSQSHSCSSLYTG